MGVSSKVDLMAYLRVWEAAAGEEQVATRVFWFMTRAIETLVVIDADKYYGTLCVRDGGSDADIP